MEYHFYASTHKVSFQNHVLRPIFFVDLYQYFISKLILCQQNTKIISLINLRYLKTNTPINKYILLDEHTIRANAVYLDL